MKAFIYALLTIGLISCENETRKSEIQIQWAKNISGDFSFKDHWSYPEGIFINEFGQLYCDGLCPPEIVNMIDAEGRIIADSLEAFYNLIDTTHYYHSINSESNAYEWAGTDFISVKRMNKDTVICYTQNNAATHSSLNLIITENTVKPTIILNSVFLIETQIFTCIKGKMVIDKDLWKKGVLKAAFSFDFEDIERLDNPLYWKGEIYSIIEE